MKLKFAIWIKLEPVRRLVIRRGGWQPFLLQNEVQPVWASGFFVKMP